MTRAESALATAKRLAEVAAEEQRLGRLIQDELFWCENDGGAGKHWVNDVDVHFVTHLAAFLEADKRNRYEHDPMGDSVFSDARERARAAMTDCPRCSAAWKAIQDRKAVRRRRGALRAALVRIGKLANQEAERGE